MTKDVIDAIQERRSVRHYQATPIPMATITRIIEAGAWAPSAGNRQPWRFLIVLNEEKRRGLARAAFNQMFIVEAPCTIVVCAEPNRSAERYGGRGSSLYCLQDTAAAAQNMLLAATAFGLGTCWVGAFDEREAAKVLEIPYETLRPVAMVVLGYAAERAKSPPRRPIGEIVEVID